MKKHFICIVPILLMLAALFAAVPAFAAETPQVRLMGDAQEPVTPIEVTYENSEIDFVEWYFLYTGEEIKPKVTATVNGVPLTEGVDFTCTYENNVNPGSHATVYVHFIGNYSGSRTLIFTIASVWEEVAYAVMEGYSVDIGADYVSSVEVDNMNIVTLLRDIELMDSDEEIMVQSFRQDGVIFDLNGHTINANGKRIFHVKTGNLTIRDSSEKKTGTITGGKASRGGAVYVEMSGNLTLESGTISACCADNSGGAIYVESGEFTMTGGTITNCRSEKDGGGVYINGESEFTMTGGEITENEARNGSFGAGVYCDGNAAIGGTAVISGNLRSPDLSRIPDDLYVRNPINIADGENAPKQGMNVGVTIPGGEQSGCGAFTGKCDDLSAFFFVDDPCRKLVYADGMMQIIPKPTSVTLRDGTVTVSYVSLVDEAQVGFCVAAYDQNGKMLGITYKTEKVSDGMNEVPLVLPGNASERYVVFTFDAESGVSLGNSIPIQESPAK